MKESEITADLTESNFKKYIQHFTKTLGAPSLKRRISFMILERGAPLDNRIKITNGVAMIVQKIKSKSDVPGLRINDEIEIDIPNDLENVKKSIKLLENFYNIFETQALKLIVQHENYLWENDEFELKLSRQFGKNDLYLYEIESFGDKTPEQLEKELNLKPDFDAFSEERQVLRRGQIDIPFDEISEEETDELIRKYLDYK